MSTGVPGPPGIDSAAVEVWLAPNDPRATPPFRFQRLGHGKSNLTVLAVDTCGRRWVLRRPPLGQVASSAYDVVREQRILCMLEGTGVTVPRVLAVTEDPNVSDAPVDLEATGLTGLASHKPYASRQLLLAPPIGAVTHP
jgi:aminoglycoside phosphotransferase (APT) family kinase protein